MSVLRIKNLLKKLEELESSKMLTFVEVAAKNQNNFIIELNQRQLDAGLNNKGEKIEPPYTPFTVEKKKQEGRPYDKVTLLDTGDWQNNMEAEHYKNKIEIVSHDWKEELLQDKYGEEIEGLTDEHIIDVSNEMLPDILESTRKFLKI